MLLVYVPGAFKWAEYGLSAIEDAVDDASYEDGPGDASDYSAWFLDRMVAELVAPPLLVIGPAGFGQAKRPCPAGGRRRLPPRAT